MPRLERARSPPFKLLQSAASRCISRLWSGLQPKPAPRMHGYPGGHLILPSGNLLPPCYPMPPNSTGLVGPQSRKMSWKSPSYVRHLRLSLCENSLLITESSRSRIALRTTSTASSALEIRRVVNRIRDDTHIVPLILILCAIGKQH
jgi:hypothetical protein